MATYNYLVKETGEHCVTENFDTIADAEKWFEAHPEYEWLPSSMKGVVAVDPWRLGRKKPDAEFRSILRDIKKRYPRSDINTFDMWAIFALNSAWLASCISGLIANTNVIM